jgi:hypothetical protein
MSLIYLIYPKHMHDVYNIGVFIFDVLLWRGNSKLNNIITILWSDYRRRLDW